MQNRDLIARNFLALSGADALAHMDDKTDCVPNATLGYFIYSNYTQGSDVWVKDNYGSIVIAPGTFSRIQLSATSCHSSPA